MTMLSAQLKPGPKRLAAALALAGFSEHDLYPDLVDACGKPWHNPSALKIALALCGAEASGHAWIYHANADGSVDYGVLEINNHAHPQWFGAQTDPTQRNWANYADNAAMAFDIWTAARAERIEKYGQPSDDWKPWVAYSGGGYLAARYAGRSWMDWADYGVTQLNKSLAGGASLGSLASVDLDPLSYWTESTSAD